MAKGSYYNNPTHDRPTEDAALIRQFPAYCTPNVWPEGGDCPDLESAFKALGRLIVSVGELVGDQIDRVAASTVPSYPPHYLRDVISTSLDCKVGIAARAHWRRGWQGRQEERGWERRADRDGSNRPLDA